MSPQSPFDVFDVRQVALGGGFQPGYNRLFQLADAFAGYTEQLADLFQRFTAVKQAEPAGDDLSLSFALNSLKDVLDDTFDVQFGVGCLNFFFHLTSVKPTSIDNGLVNYKTLIFKCQTLLAICLLYHELDLCAQLRLCLFYYIAINVDK
jgi:hypothetical protein